MPSETQILINDLFEQIKKLMQENEELRKIAERSLEIANKALETK